MSDAAREAREIESLIRERDEAEALAQRLRAALHEIALSRTINCAYGHLSPCDCGGDKARAALALAEDKLAEAVACIRAMNAEDR